MKSDQLPLNRIRSLFVFLFIFVVILCCSPFTVCALAGGQTSISSETLEYLQEKSLYIAKGKVRIEKENVILEADEIIYNTATDDAVATGSVRYSDSDVVITAERVEMNLTAKTGRLSDAEILFRKDNYRITGKEFEKKGDGYYISPAASFTTCDGLIPSWCFGGKQVSLITGQELNARDVSFRIKNLPVFYTPYFLAPILAERKTGFLLPDIGYSTAKGLYFHIPFYWAISESSDATLLIDEYTKRGIGEGLEYRYVTPEHVKGSWLAYHIKDTELNKDFFELKGIHNQRNPDSIGGFLSVNYINEKDFYREFHSDISIRSNRFLESTGEISLPLTNSRAYVLSQYWIDLKDNSFSPVQRLPEAGYILNPVKYNQFWFSASSSVSNFWRDDGMFGQWLDIYPRISHTLGKDIVLTQTLGLRETAYSLHRDAPDENPHRESLEYSLIGNTRLFKKYGSLIHIVEPSLGYTLILNSENDLPVFDSAELFRKTSTLELAVLNRLRDQDGEIMVIRLSQGFDSERGDRPFLPFRVEVGIKRPLSLRLEARYDVHTGDLENINSDMSFSVSDATFSAGQRYSKKDDISFYRTGLGFRPFKPLYLEGNVWYDAREEKLKDIGLSMLYSHQCWGFRLMMRKVPGDFDISFRFELKGLSKSLNM
ncbi:MAG: LPS assembly protein LptD [Thermodesulfovibrionales bacterium]|nr:LPS assembly protein LptD [Thermodesulfovibrionales bacterium]